MSWGEFRYGFRLEEKDPVTYTINYRVFEKELADNEAKRDQVDILYTYKYGVIQYRLPDDEIYILSIK